MKEKIKRNIPNMITISRLIASALAATFFVSGNYLGALGLYIYGAVSDAFDGMAARKLNAFTKLGRKLDPFSDKMYAASLLIPSILRGNIFMLLPTILELKISIENYQAMKKGISLETERVGKFKTASLFPTMILGLLSTIDPIFLIALAPVFGLSTYLQLESIKAYNQQFEIKQQTREKIDDDSILKEAIENNNQKKINVKKKKIEQLRDLKFELEYYLTNPIEDTNVKRRVKENDRYKVNKRK